MFGDTIVNGTETIKTDSKSRVFLSTNTGVETGDHIIVINHPEIECYELLSERDYLKLIDEYESKVNQALAESYSKYVEALKAYQEYIDRITEGVPLNNTGYIVNKQLRLNLSGVLKPNSTYTVKRFSNRYLINHQTFTSEN